MSLLDFIGKRYRKYSYVMQSFEFYRATSDQLPDSRQNSETIATIRISSNRPARPKSQWDRHRKRAFSIVNTVRVQLSKLTMLVCIIYGIANLHNPERSIQIYSCTYIIRLTRRLKKSRFICILINLEVFIIIIITIFLLLFFKYVSSQTVHRASKYI